MDFYLHRHSFHRQKVPCSYCCFHVNINPFGIFADFTFTKSCSEFICTLGPLFHERGKPYLKGNSLMTEDFFFCIKTKKTVSSRLVTRLDYFVT